MNENESHQAVPVDTEFDDGGIFSLPIHKIDHFFDRDRKDFLSSRYLQDNLQHMRQYQPLVAGMVVEQPITDFEQLLYFRAGALSTYDLIHLGDPDYWESKQISSDVILSTLKNFQDSVIIQDDGMLKADRERAVVQLEWFYDTLSTESPRYIEWLEYATDTLKLTNMVDFLFGSLLTAMPFYLTKESERLEATFGF